MRIYIVEIADYDLYGDYGYYDSLERAKTRVEELKKDPKFLWKKYLRISEKELKS